MSVVNQNKNFLVENGYITKSQNELLKGYIQEQTKRGIKEYYIQVARREKYITEDESAECLTRLLKREVISKDSLDIQAIKKLNTNLINHLSNFFYKEINIDTREIIVCKDISSVLAKHEIEKRYPGFNITEIWLVDGVTSEIINEILAE